MSFFSGLLQSFDHAWRGVMLAFRTERSFRLQVGAGLIVVILLIILPLQDWERVVLLLAMAAVLVLELMNSMVERLVDLAKPRLNQYVRDIKDLMAAAVLVASLFALVVGLLVLWPYAAQLIGRL